MTLKRREFIFITIGLVIVVWSFLDIFVLKTSKQTPTRQVTESTYSKLEITEVIQKGNEVVITGKTDLPNSSLVMVGLDVAGRQPTDLYIGKSEKVHVFNGEFSAEIIPPQREEFMGGVYEISVTFTPYGQYQDVLSLVGNKGEHLTGIHASKSSDINTMERTKIVNLELSIEPPTYTFQPPSEFEEGTPERAVAEYVSAWKDQDWKRMAQFAQLTWQKGQDDPAGMLDDWHSWKTLYGFEVKGSRQISPTTAEITYVVQYEAATNQISKKEVTARVIKEAAPNQPSESGKWGVNPLSTIKEK